MNNLRVVLAVSLLARLPVQAQSSRPTLTDGVVTVTIDGRRVQISPRKSTDLWVSPDESVVSFIAIEEEKPSTNGEIEAHIEKSSIYIAKKADRFKLVRIPIRISIDRRVWEIAREPKISPDLRTVYFFVPDSMAAWTLIGKHLPDNAPRTIGKAKDFCVVWGGTHAGDLAMLTRREAAPGDPTSGVTFPCFVRGRGGALTKLQDDCWDAFSSLVTQWSLESGGTCN